MDKWKDPILRRFQAAKARRDQWDPILADIYAMVAPQVDVQGTGSEGEKRDTTLYEGQGVRSMKKRANRMHGQLYPAFEDFLELACPGIRPDALQGDKRTAYEAAMSAAQTSLHLAVDTSNFHIEIDQVIKDLLISTGAIQVNPGDPDDMPLVFEALPIHQLVPEESPRGLLENVFRPREVPRRDVKILWPDATVPESEDWYKRLEQDPDGKVKVLEAQLWDPKRGHYDYTVFLPDDDEHVLVRRTWKKRRIIVARMDRYTGNLLGCGPAMDVRADLKTANKVKELTLKNGAIAVAGIWQADDDGVLNPANIKLVPGTIIPKAVGSQGLQPLASAARFDLSQILLADLQAAIKDMIEGPPRPGYDQNRPVAYAFLSAEREQAEVEVPSHTRIFRELDQPLWEAVLDILSNDAFKGSDYYIPAVTANGKTLMPRPVNPLVRLKRQAKAQGEQRAYAMAAAIDPQTTAMVVMRAPFIRNLLIQGGFPTDYLYPADRVDQIQKMIDEMNQKMAQAYQAGLAKGAMGAAKMAGTEDGAAVLSGAGQLAQSMGVAP